MGAAGTVTLGAPKEREALYTLKLARQDSGTRGFGALALGVARSGVRPVLQQCICRRGEVLGEGGRAKAHSLLFGIAVWDVRERVSASAGASFFRLPRWGDEAACSAVREGTEPRCLQGGGVEP